MYLEMLCKENIVTWFKDLTSFKRIDVMCNLLQSCQPFETRFLGTCIEELGRKDFSLLRHLENIVNNPTELSSQDLNNIKDRETRSKISQFLCVLHSNNKKCANELFTIMMGFNEDLNNIIKSGAFFNDDSPLDEILLIYALGIFHPAFSFERKVYLGGVLARLLHEEEQIQLFRRKQEMVSPDSYPSDSIAVSQMVTEPLPTQGCEDPAAMMSMPVLTYVPTMPAVISPQISHTSSPSGSPPVRAKLPKYPPSMPPPPPLEQKGVSPNQLRPMSEPDVSTSNGVSPTTMKELRLITNGKITDEAPLRRPYVMPMCTSVSPCQNCLQSGITPPPVPPPPNNKPDTVTFVDQMRDLRLSVEASGVASNTTTTNSSSDSNNSDFSPPTTPHDGRSMSSSSSSQQPFSRGRGSTHQYRRRTEMNGHDHPVNSSSSTAAADPSYFAPQPQQQPPQPFIAAPAYPIPLIQPYFPDIIYQQQYPCPPQTLTPLFQPLSLPRLPSCYNCGSQSHLAVDCPDPTIDEVSKQGQYRLDYEGPQFNNMNEN